jgi:hypothetical protein
VQGVAIANPDTWVGAGFSAEEIDALTHEIGFDVAWTDGEGTQFFWHWWIRRPGVPELAP